MYTKTVESLQMGKFLIKKSDEINEKPEGYGTMSMSRG